MQYRRWYVVIICFMAIFTLHTTCYTQPQNIARFEREYKSSDSEYILIPMAEKGIVLLRDTEDYHEGKKRWQVTLLNSDLLEQWVLDLDVDSHLPLVGYDYKDDLVYILFRSKEHETSDIHLYTIDLTTRGINDSTIKQEMAFKITHMSILDHSVVLGGYVNNEPAILIYDRQSENIKVVPGFFVNQTELLDLRTNVNNTFNTLIIDRHTREDVKLILRTFDASGTMLLEDIITMDRKKTILAGLTSSLINDEIVITGTWSYGSNKMATGIFSTVVDPFNEQPINYYDFGQLNHFFDYQSKKRATKLKEKSSKSRAESEIPDFKTYASVLRLEEHPDGYALLTEVYQPSSSISTSPYWSGYSPYPGYGYYPYYYSTFNRRFYNYPYQYNSAPQQTGDAKMLYSAVIVFNRKGQLLDDYGIVLDNKKNEVIEQTSDFIFSGNRVAIAYKKEKQIFIKEEYQDGLSSTDTLSSYNPKPGELIRSDSEDSFIRFWYDKFMYTWGYMHIKDLTDQPDDPHRNVFYINKIKFD